jgi:hypothetical protein
MGWLIWLMEAFVAVSLILGLFTRLGGLAALIQAVNLYIGVTAAPFEWYWTYGMLATLGLVFLAVPTGRVFGLDAWLRPRLQWSRSRKSSRKFSVPDLDLETMTRRKWFSASWGFSYRIYSSRCLVI